MHATLPFTKMHGLGNDFIVFNNLAQNIILSAAQIRLLADRHYGIGADQILLLEPPPRANIDFGYRIFNSDGSESGQCGNGVRCLARFIQHNALSTQTTFTIATTTSTMQVELQPDQQVTVNMGQPNFQPAALPMLLPLAQQYTLTIAKQNIQFSALSMGNPHIVIRVPTLDSTSIQAIGHACNNHPTFPAGVNVGFMQIIDRQHIKLRVFERGAGETLACGSGACAALVAASQQGWVDNQAEITLPGGRLQVRWQADQPVWMTGPATLVGEGFYFMDTIT